MKGILVNVEAIAIRIVALSHQYAFEWIISFGEYHTNAYFLARYIWRK